jgi:hypothetical protein
MLRFAIVAVAGFALAACSSLGVPGGQAVRSIDYANDDVANLLIAFDLPETIEPTPEGPVLNFDVVVAAGEKRSIRAVLVRSDAGELAGTLPPPGDGRVYYLFGFDEAEKTKIRETQAWAKTQPPGQGGGLGITFEPRFCATKAVDPAKVRYSVLVALPGAGSLAPLAKDQPLSAALTATGATLPVCEGHSG